MYDRRYACSEQYGGDFFGYRTSGSKSFQVGFSLRVNESAERAVTIEDGSMFSHKGYYLGKVCPNVFRPLFGEIEILLELRVIRHDLCNTVPPVLHLASFCYPILLLPT